MILRPVRPVSRVGTAQLEDAGRVGQDPEVGAVELGGEQRVDDVVPQVGQEEGLEVDARIVLGRDQHRLERDGPPVLVADADLGLAVRAEVGQRAHVAYLCQPLCQPVGEPDRQRHQIGRLVAGVAEHHPLVPGALRVELVLSPGAGPNLEGLVHALPDVGRLLVERDDDPAGVPVDAVGVVVVADVEHGLAHQLRDVHVGRGGDLPRHQHQAGGQQRLARDPAARVVGQHRVEHRVGDLVRHLVRMSFGDGLRGEGVSGAHGVVHSARLVGPPVFPGNNSAHTLSKTASATESLADSGTPTADPSAPKMVT